MDELSPGAGGLERHGLRVARDLESLGLPPHNWPALVTGPDGAAMRDVVVIGAGMFGLAAAAALLFKGVRNITVLDRADEGSEGPWTTTARMLTLRSPKQLPGIALGVPSLTYREWHVARYGEAAWDTLYKISNTDWMDYLTWVRRVLALPVQNRVAVERIVPQDGCLRIDMERGAPRYARRVVVATGRAGAGGLSIPEGIDLDLWPDRAAHTGEAIDFAALRGKHVSVLGAGASAWDNAATALEFGAASVTMYARRPYLPQVNKGRGSANPGFLEGWATLSDEERWKLLVYKHDLQGPPPHETVLRTIAHQNFAVRFAAPIGSARRTETGIELRIGVEEERCETDFLIVGTGFAVDLAARPELTELVPHLALWRDVYTPPLGDVRDELGAFPYLGDGFELTERTPGACPALGRVHLFSHAAFASLGPIASDIPGASVAAERLASRLAQSLFREDLDHMRAALEAFDEPELGPTPFFVPPDRRS